MRYKNRIHHQKKTISSIFAMLCLLTIFAFGQSVSGFEQDFVQLQRQITAEIAALDSLQAVLAVQTAKIDRAKHRETIDKGELRQLMSDGLTLTEQINRRQQRLSKLKENLARAKYNLSKAYSLRVDSLKKLESSGKYSGDSAQLHREIIFYTEKYLLFSPSFQALRFDPHKISRINPANSSDSLEQAIMIEYLKNAGADIDAHLTSIQNNRRELEGVVRLKRKTQAFLEDVDDEPFGVLGGGELSAAATRKLDSETGNFSDVAGVDAGRSLQQYESISLFFDQLDLNDPVSSDAFRKFSVDSARVFVSLDEYLELLKAAEKRLKEFQTLITQKLEAGKHQK